MRSSLQSRLHERLGVYSWYNEVLQLPITVLAALLKDLVWPTET